MQPDPVIEVNKICSLGAGDLIAGAVTEPKQSHSTAVIQGKWVDFSWGHTGPCEVPAMSLLLLWQL